MKLIDFYIKSLEPLNIETTEDGFIRVVQGEEKYLVTIGKKSLVLPLEAHNSTLLDENGELNKILYNPLQEDVIKGVNSSMSKLNNMIDRKLSMTTSVIMRLLSILVSDVELQKKSSLYLNQFVSSLNPLRKQNMKQLVDEKVISIISKVYDATLTLPENKGLVHIYSKKGGLLDGSKYNRVSILSLPIYDEICKDETIIPNVEFKRPKDKEIIKKLFEFIFELEDTTKYFVGSNNDTSPVFISVYKTFIKISNRLNMLLDNLSFIDEKMANESKINLKLSIEDIESVNVYNGELKMIPKDGVKTSVEMSTVMNNKAILGIDKPTALPTYDSKPQVGNNLSTLLHRNEVQQPSVMQQPLNQVNFSSRPLSGLAVKQVAGIEDNYRPQYQQGYHQGYQNQRIMNAPRPGVIDPRDLENILYGNNEYSRMYQPPGIRR